MIDNKKLREIEASGDNTLIVDVSTDAAQTGDYEYYVKTTISEEEITKLVNGDIKAISGTFKYVNGEKGYFSTSYCGNKTEYGRNFAIYEGVNVNTSTNKLEKFHIEYNITSHSDSIVLRYVQYVLTRG